jgi:hypothetical protein
MWSNNLFQKSLKQFFGKGSRNWGPQSLCFFWQVTVSVKWNLHKLFDDNFRFRGAFWLNFFPECTKTLNFDQKRARSAQSFFPSSYRYFCQNSHFWKSDVFWTWQIFRIAPIKLDKSIRGSVGPTTHCSLFLLSKIDIEFGVHLTPRSQSRPEIVGSRRQNS